MGLFSFLKKKDSSVPTTQSPDLSSLNTDLPKVDGSNLKELTLPSLDDSQQELVAVSSPIDDNSSPSNDTPQTDDTPQTGGYHDHALHSMPEDLSKDINQLFLSDPEWKEPDWEHYEPYYEEKIEPPTMEDFGITPPQPEVMTEPTTLPEAPSENYSEKSFDVPEFDDVELSEHHVPSDIPYDVFVKGTDYSKVFSEMEDVKKILAIQDEKILRVLETFKQEELNINSCKDNMEFLYKKMLTIDKKVFA